MPKQLLEFASPYMNAAGMLGFAPDKRVVGRFAQFGAFVTNPVSLRPRKPANGERLIRFPGGALLHTGHPNPGLSAVIKQVASNWARQDLPVIVHLLANYPNEVRGMLERLEELENIAAVELGLPAEIEVAEAVMLCQAAVGELPLIVRVPVGKALPVGEAVIQVGADAVSLGAERGTLPGTEEESVSGRLYGPAQYVQGLQAVKDLVGAGVSVIGAGGIYNREQAEEMLSAGALAVQLDTVLWKGEILGESG